MTSQNSDVQPPPEVAAARTGDAGGSDAARFFSAWQQRTEELVAGGLREGHARGLAQLEIRIAQWPSGWGEDLVVLIYGDFNPPPAELDFPDLGITIEPEKVTNSIIKSALCVLKARVKIPEKSVRALVDASARINTLLGALAVLNWGNSGSGWWSAVTHGSIGGVMPKLEPDRVRKVVEALRNLPPPVARNVRSALYWVREPRQLVMEGHRSDVLRVYAGYWNAFECLVEAVCLIRPQTKLGRAEKQAGIDAFVGARSGRLDAAAVSECYKAFVDPAAWHALECHGRACRSAGDVIPEPGVDDGKALAAATVGQALAASRRPHILVSCESPTQPLGERMSKNAASATTSRGSRADLFRLSRLPCRWPASCAIIGHESPRVLGH